MMIRFTNPDGEPVFINSDHVLEICHHVKDSKLVCILTIDGSEFFVRGSLEGVAAKLNNES